MEQESSIRELVNKKPDENSGSMASNRFGYQKHWALNKLLELDKEGKDFSIILDYHEDVIVVDKSIKERNIDFYQIKSRDGATWTMSELCSSSMSKNENTIHSILGKLLKHSIDFNNARRYYFVTNSYFPQSQFDKKSNDRNAKEKKGPKDDELNFADFSKDKQKIAKDKICKELPDINKKAFDNFFVKQHELSVKADLYIPTLKGLIGEFISNMNLSDATISVDTLYEHLINEIERKQNKEDIITEDNILENRKSITRKSFRGHIKSIADNKDFIIVVNEISNQLDRSGVSFNKKRKFLHVIKENIQSLLYDYNNSELIYLKGKISNAIAQLSDSDSNDTFYDFSQKIFQIVKSGYTDPLQFGDELILGLCMYYYAK